MLEIKRNGDTLDVIGEVDISTAQIFKDGISELVEDEVPVIRLNMNETEYIDSTGSARR